MEHTINVRALAVKALVAINRDGAYANIIIGDMIKQSNLGDVDRRFFTELVYGVIRRRNYLDAIIAHLTGKPVKKLSAIVLDILRLGIYQIIYLDKVPTSAAVNESVKLTKKMARGMDRLVNALLRNVERKADEISIDALAKSEVERLAYIYNQPLWLASLWVNMYGVDAASELLAYYNTTPHLTGRINTLKVSDEVCLAALTKAGWEAHLHESIPHAVIIDHHKGALGNAEFVKNGWLTFMDPASMLVGLVASPKRGDRVLDVCAAPGGKSFHMAALMGNEGEIISGDIHDHKVELLREGAKRLGASIVHAQEQDGTQLTYDQEFDVVLVDAPCSGLGILQKRPDMRWRKEAAQLDALPPLQGQILRAAAKAVKPGGTLVYSTCTINPKENEDVVNAFLQDHPEFILDDASQYIPLTIKGPMVTILPHVESMDGFFMARMIRRDHD